MPHCATAQLAGLPLSLRKKTLEGQELDEPVYQVLLEGRAIGPYDRRTIVGMRIKKALTSEHVLIRSDGTQLTVKELVNARPRDKTFESTRSGSYSVVQASYPASLLGVQGAGMSIPAFSGEIEARVQSKHLRVAGRFRQGLRWKDDRVKLPLQDIVHARVRASVVDLWLRSEGQHGFLRVTMELFTPEAAGEFVEWLPNATPWPQPDTQPAALPSSASGFPMVWLAVIGSAVLVAAVLALVLSRRLY